ncbi:MAG TPA: LptF/LptG family permease [Chitinophagales bacterium]|nr:LptF/LptG family permease [Chitinophagales bacterium]HNB48238.1 LptF/LptG family permease [Chitinophagales bacterium]HNC72388.1 LptF/LptG family permease [Chitinophagales bacterium]HNK10409.1 LptF/LptG family permease [Chitinophagales bacterium]HNK73335.1 LptF/LptG family permease [Chitinophagales bacterium]
MKILDRYIIKKFLITFFFAIFLLSAIAIVIDITEKIDEFIDNQAPLHAIVVDYYLNFIPWIGLMLAPIFVFISVVYFTSRLTANTEVICMLNGGVSFYRLLFPYLFTAVLLAMLFDYYNHELLPKNNKVKIKFEEQYASKKNQRSADINYHFQIGKDTFIYTQSFDINANTGFKFTLEEIKNKVQRYKFTSENMSWDTTAKKWRMRNWTFRKSLGNRDSIGKGMDSLMSLPVTAKEYAKQNYDIETMTTKELKQFIIDQKHKGNENVKIYEVEKFRRTAIPFSTIILTLIAVAMTTKKVRNGMGLYIVAGMLLSGAYIIIQQFSTVFATKGNLDPLIAVWIPNIIFGIIAALLIKRAPK